MSSLLVKNAAVLQTSPDAVNVLQAHDILIRDNRIETIQPTGVDASHFDHLIDANGQIAMPSFINTHAHVPMTLFRGLAEDINIVQWFNEMWQLEANLQPEDVYWGMMLGIVEMIESGVTAVAEHYWHMHHAARAVEESGIRGLLGWAMFANQGMEAIDNTAHFVQQWQNSANGRIRTIFAPHAPYTCDDDFLREVVRRAKQADAGIHIHVSENAQQREASLQAHGKTPVEVVRDVGVLDRPTILAHLCGATEADLDIVAQYQAGVAHAPKTYLKLAMGFAPVTDMRQRGIPVGLATDGPVSNNTLSLWESMRLMAMTQKHRADAPEAMPLHEVLYITTQESARVYMQPDDLGTLSAGRLADLILVDVNGVHHQPLHSIPATLVYNTQPTDVQTVICDGQVLMHNRQLLTLDKSEIIAQARNSMQRLSQKVPGARIQFYEG
jgi:5-methylthioadenosine/S-adenosylhomocysteine deaminase